MELNGSLKWSFDVILEEMPSAIENPNNSYLLFRFILFVLASSFLLFLKLAWPVLMQSQSSYPANPNEKKIN